MTGKPTRMRLGLLQWSLVAVFLLTLLSGWLLPDVSELWVRSLFWGLLWPTLTVSALLLTGPLFCSLCPLGVLGRRISRYGLGKRLPRRATWVGWSAFSLFTGYWLVSSISPGYARLPLECTLGFFTGLLLLMLLLSLVYRDAPFCRSVCPFAILLKLFGSSGWVKLARAPAPAGKVGACETCESCKQVNCAPVCPHKLLPGKVAGSDKISACNLCLECYKECDQLRLTLGAKTTSAAAVTSWGRSLTLPISLFLLFALVAIQTQLQHRWDKGAFRELMPWHGLDGLLGGMVSLSWFDSRSLALALCAVLLTLMLLAASLMAAYALSGKPWRTLLTVMAHIPIPLVLLLLLSHGLMSFATRGAPGLIAGLGQLLGTDWAISGLARNSVLLPVFGLLLWLGVGLSLYRGWRLVSELQSTAQSRLSLWLVVCAPVWLFLSLRFGGMLLAAPAASCH